jgi:hypothetical protein
MNKNKKTKGSMTNDNITIMPEMANAVICPDTGKSLKHVDAIHGKQNKQTLQHKYNQIYPAVENPKGKKIICVDIKDHKEEKERTRLTVGGDQVEYPGDKSTRTAGLTTAKILINSVISTMGAKFLVIDIKKFYLNTPLEDSNTL